MSSFKDFNRAFEPDFDFESVGKMTELTNSDLSDVCMYEDNEHPSNHTPAKWTSSTFSSRDYAGKDVADVDMLMAEPASYAEQQALQHQNRYQKALQLAEDVYNGFDGQQHDSYGDNSFA